MSKKEIFVEILEDLFKDVDMEKYCGDSCEDFMSYWNAFKNKEEKVKPKFTDNGKLILKYMQEHIDDMPMVKARDIGEGILVSSRSITGAMRKLVNDGYVERLGKDPVVYSLTSLGSTVNIDE